MANVKQEGEDSGAELFSQKYSVLSEPSERRKSISSQRGQHSN